MGYRDGNTNVSEDARLSRTRDVGSASTPGCGSGCHERKRKRARDVQPAKVEGARPMDHGIPWVVVDEDSWWMFSRQNQRCRLEGPVGPPPCCADPLIIDAIDALADARTRDQCNHRYIHTSPAGSDTAPTRTDTDGQWYCAPSRMYEYISKKIAAEARQPERWGVDRQAGELLLRAFSRLRPLCGPRPARACPCLPRPCELREDDSHAKAGESLRKQAKACVLRRPASCDSTASLREGGGCTKEHSTDVGTVAGLADRHCGGSVTTTV